MCEKLTQNKVNSVVWKACDSFRGVIDPAQYKDYILTMLFVKYISDVHKECFEMNMMKYGGDEVRVKRAMKRERFFLETESTFDYLYNRMLDDNLGELINIALESIESNNRTKLQDVFRNIDFNSDSNLGEKNERNSILKNLLGDLAELDLRPSNLCSNDIIGDAYEFLISNFAADSGKKAGEFYTPGEVSTLLAKLVNAQSGDRICDPTCGSGSLLLKAAHEAGDINVSISGQELNASTWALARMNMFLHGMDNATIMRGDTLRNPLLVTDHKLNKFDVVVANPPFSLAKWGYEDCESDRYNRFHRGLPPKSKGDYAFITHMIETLNVKGRMGVVLPHGTLFRGASEGKIRKQLIEEGLLKAVIGLPSNLFYGTSIPACILLFDKSRDMESDVLFVDASQGFEKGKNQNKLRSEDIQKILNTVQRWEELEKYSQIVSLDEIRENDYNLNIPRYVDTFEEEEPIDIKAVAAELVNLDKKLEDVNSEIVTYCSELGIPTPFNPKA